MEDAALVIAIVSLGFSGWALLTSHRVERREVGDGPGPDERAELDVTGGELARRRDDFGVQLRFRNVGRADARDLRAWLVDGNGRIASGVVDVGAALPPSLGVGMTVVVATGPLPVPESLSVHGSWTDEAGAHDDEPLGPWRYP